MSVPESVPATGDSAGRGEPVSRRLLLAGVASAAALAGAGLAWWRMRPAPVADGAAAAALWSHTFETPAGQPLAMASLRGRPLVLNFWATWCPPCVEEMPLLDGFHRENSSTGWKVVGLAIDQPTSVRQFLARTPVSFPVGFAGLEGTELGRALGNTTGGLPFSVLIGSDGSVRQRKMGQLSAADLARWKAAASA